jgi:hypothetical protein
MQNVIVGIILLIAIVFCARKLYLIICGKEETPCAFCNKCKGGKLCDEDEACSAPEDKGNASEKNSS